MIQKIRTVPDSNIDHVLLYVYRTELVCIYQDEKDKDSTYLSRQISNHISNINLTYCLMNLDNVRLQKYILS